MKRKNKKQRWVLQYSGVIVLEQRKNPFKQWLQRVFCKRYTYEWVTILEFAPKKSYNKAEKDKLAKYLEYDRELTQGDICHIVNEIRPNSITNDLTQLKTNKYYLNVTAKEDIYLPRPSKKVQD